MQIVLNLIALWGVADGLFLALFPHRWAHWWGKWLGELSENLLAARLVGVLEIGLSLTMLLRDRSEVRT